MCRRANTNATVFDHGSNIRYVSLDALASFEGMFGITFGGQPVASSIKAFHSYLEQRWKEGAREFNYEAESGFISQKAILLGL